VIRIGGGNAGELTEILVRNLDKSSSLAFVDGKASTELLLFEKKSSMARSVCK
jgi:hypothetical protein